MASRMWKIARWLVGIGLLIIGASNVPEPSSSIEQRWGPMIPWPWLEANWIALACFVLAALLLAYTPLQWWIERKTAKDVRLRIRANPVPGTYHETDGAQALNYLLRESAWAWKEYARLNSWTWVDGLHIREFGIRARDGDIITTGWDGQKNEIVVIDGRIWADGCIEVSTATTPQRVVMGAGPTYRRMTFSQIRTSTADMHWIWPRASLARRWRSRARVWLKLRVWYGSRLSNWLDGRRLSKKKRKDL